MSFNTTFENGTNFNNSSFNGSTFENGADTTATQYKKISIFTPIIYVSLLLFSLMYLQKYVSNKKQQKSIETPSIFEDNYKPREVYYAIKEKQYKTSNGSDKIDENALLAALIHRGASVIRYKIKLTETKQTFDLLYKLGSMGEDFYERYEREFKLIDLEIEDCVREYTILTKSKNNPQRFVEICQNVCFNEAIKRRVAFYDSKVQNKLK
ncbi:hypothetical protein FOG51_03233 [Hanseniaspora uvarum]|uniref:Translocation protein SEC66 n=1 Tax=Hanseniaspora uvarum TaxID=29833 RepID=A0A1E5RUG3_HANUV|nr:hypothetical protein FOG48_01549 [Hanseniaspora uvarum]KAF0271852.1 hypothetical protein FOG51_03233 [Hanseniaspora uvarum]KAF0277729.1 hypothetical protein FOG50_01419 [Hanseniaspora uvarum]OEJ90541.1 Translocation protein SEC66 [Hanseniaspora uvarum]GMM41806.1 Sec63 complex subunit [Hanseniaspora uvarum]